VQEKPKTCEIGKTIAGDLEEKNKRRKMGTVKAFLCHLKIGRKILN